MFLQYDTVCQDLEISRYAPLMVRAAIVSSATMAAADLAAALDDRTVSA